MTGTPFPSGPVFDSLSSCCDILTLHALQMCNDTSGIALCAGEGGSSRVGVELCLRQDLGWLQQIHRSRLAISHPQVCISLLTPGVFINPKAA